MPLAVSSANLLALWAYKQNAKTNGTSIRSMVVFEHASKLTDCQGILALRTAIIYYLVIYFWNPFQVGPFTPLETYELAFAR